MAAAGRPSWLAEWVWDNPAAVMVLRTRNRPKQLFCAYVLFPAALLLAYWYFTSFSAIGLIGIPIGIMAALPMAVAGAAAALFIRDREKRTAEALRLTLLSPARLICGRFLALFLDLSLPFLLAVPFFIAALALDVRLRLLLLQLPFPAPGPGLILCLPACVGLVIAFSIATGFAFGTVVRHAAGAHLAAFTAVYLLGFGLPAMFLYMLDSVFGKVPSTLTADLVITFFMLCHLLATIILLRAAHQQLLRQDGIRDDD